MRASHIPFNGLSFCAFLFPPPSFCLSPFLESLKIPPFSCALFWCVMRSPWHFSDTSLRLVSLGFFLKSCSYVCQWLKASGMVGKCDLFMWLCPDPPLLAGVIDVFIECGAFVPQRPALKGCLCFAHVTWPEWALVQIWRLLPWELSWFRSESTFPVFHPTSLSLCYQGSSLVSLQTTFFLHYSPY